MRRGTKVFVTLFFLFFLVMAAGAAISLWFFMEPRVEEDSVLIVDISGALVEHRPVDGFAELFGDSSVSVVDVVNSIHAAKDDPRIEGLLLRLNGASGLDMAKAFEIRQALLAFREGGKPSHVFLESASTIEYFLASACENVYLMPGGELWTTGFFIQAPFFKGSLDKLGIEPDFFAYHEYKSAADSYRRKEMSEHDREQLNALMDNWWEYFTTGIASARKLDVAKVEEAIHNSPMVPQEAYDSGFVDAILYWDQVKDRLDGTADGKMNVRWTWLQNYKDRALPSGRKKIAVVYALGPIVPGESSESLFGPSLLGSDTISRAIRQARESGSVEAIVLRVDSPGGSAQASDEIWREVIRTKEAGVPIVVSMSWVAASGGYWIAMGADHIVADPTTVTGSIGVVAGKMDWSGFYDWLGMSFDEIGRGRNAGMLTDTAKFSDTEAERMQAWMTFIYDEFIRKVSEGRGIPEEQVREIAKGRVWSGADALEIGLVDELGGLHEAIEAARKLAKIPSRDSVGLTFYPRQKTFFEALAESSQPRDLSSIEGVPEQLQQVVHQVQTWEKLKSEPVLVLDPLLWGMRIQD